MQEAARADVPYVYLLAPPLTVAYKKDRVSGFSIHPSDLYLVDRTITVRA
jgi:hypothetical protein